MKIWRILLLFLGSTAALSGGCRQQEPGTPPEESAQSSHIEVAWIPGAECRNEPVNSMVRASIEHCTSGDYQEYRLLWSDNHKPASRKRFEQLWRAVQRVEIKAIRKLQYRLPDDTITSRESPEYVLHAFVEISERAKEMSNGQLQDRDLILMIVREDDNWRFTPAPKIVKKAVLAAAKEADDAQAFPDLGKDAQTEGAPG